MTGTTQRPVFSRPLEITSSNDGFTITHSSGIYGFTVANGTYGCVNSMIYAMNNQVQNTAVTGAGGAVFGDAPYSFEMTIDTDLKVNIDTGEDIAILFSDVELAGILGFETQLSAGQTFTADWTPSHLWVPTYTFSDQGQWEIDQYNRFGGSKSNTGRLSGINISNRRYGRTFSFTAEPARNCFIAFEDAEYSLGGTTFYPNADRCFEYFVEQARISTASGTNQYTKGCYVWHSVTAFQTLTQTLGDGGVRSELSGGADQYVYCSLTVSGDSVGGAFFPVGRDRYNISDFSVETADAPVWDNN